MCYPKQLTIKVPAKVTNVNFEYSLLFKCHPYCSFQKHAHSEVQKPTNICILLLPSTILTEISENSLSLLQINSIQFNSKGHGLRFVIGKFLFSRSEFIIS